MNNIVIIGNLGKDPELKYLQSGTAVADFTVAVKRFGKDEATDWFNIIAWGKQAENCSNYIKTGSKVAITGSMQFDTYKKNDGTTGYSHKLNAATVEFLDSKKDNAGAGAGAAGYTQVVDEDIPF